MNIFKYVIFHKMSSPNRVRGWYREEGIEVNIWKMGINMEK